MPPDPEDQLYDEFENNWQEWCRSDRNDAHPDIRAFISGHAADLRKLSTEKVSRLVYHVVLLDLDYRHTERIVDDWYKAESLLPGYQTEVDQAFRKHAEDIDLQPGDVFRDHEIIEQLGAGGMSKVYHARHMILEQERAIKVIRADLLRNVDRAEMQALCDRFLREARDVAQLSDAPEFLQVFDAGVEGNRAFIVMELVKGPDLETRIKKESKNRLPADRSARLLIQVAKAIGLAHAKGYIHRDIKPANILLTETGSPKIADFGITKRRFDGARRDNAQEAVVDDEAPTAGQSLSFGTLEYMPPEQAEAPRSADERSDIYSLGATFFFMLTGSTPHDLADKTPQEKKYIVRNERARSVRDVLGKDGTRIDVDPRLASVCDQCLSYEARDRYKSVPELVTAIEAALRPPIAPGESVPLRPSDPLAFCLGMVLGALGGLLGIWPSTRAVQHLSFLNELGGRWMPWLCAAVGGALGGSFGSQYCRRDEYDDPRKLFWLLPIPATAAFSTYVGAIWTYDASFLLHSMGGLRLCVFYWGTFSFAFFGARCFFVFGCMHDYSSLLWRTGIPFLILGFGLLILSFFGWTTAAAIFAAAVLLGTLPKAFDTGGNDKLFEGDDLLLQRSLPDSGRKVVAIAANLLMIAGVWAVGSQYYGGETACLDFGQPIRSAARWDADSANNTGPIWVANCAPTFNPNESWVRFRGVANAGKDFFEPGSSRTPSLPIDYRIRLLAINPCHGHFAFEGPNGNLAVSNAGGKKQMFDLDSPYGKNLGVSAITFSPKGGMLAAGCRDGTVHLFTTGGSLSDYKKSHDLPASHSRVAAIAFSPNEKRLAVAYGSTAIESGGEPAFNEDGSRRLEDSVIEVALTERSSDRTFEPVGKHEGLINALAWTPDGKYIVAAGGDAERNKNGNAQNRDCTIRIWDANAPGSPRTLEGHNSPINSIAVSPDGRQIISGSGSAESFDYSVRLWGFASGKEEWSFRGHWGPVIWVSFGPADGVACSASEDGTMRILKIPK